MPYLFDTNALSEIFRRRPNPELATWMKALPREEQFTSSIVVAELFLGACRSAVPARWLERLEDEILPAVTVIHFDTSCARVYGRIAGRLLDAGTPIGIQDTQIAATALCYGLTVVTANARHFERVPDLQLKTFTPGDAPRGTSET